MECMCQVLVEGLDSIRVFRFMENLFETRPRGKLSYKRKNLIHRSMDQIML